MQSKAIFPGFNQLSKLQGFDTSQHHESPLKSSGLFRYWAFFRIFLKKNATLSNLSAEGSV